MYGLNRTLQDLGIAKESGETVAIASVMRNGRLSLLISGPSLNHLVYDHACASSHALI